MRRVVVDTDLVIDFLRTNSGYFPKLIDLQSKGKLEIYFSSITLMEIFAGESTVAEKDKLNELFSQFEIIPFDKSLAIYAGDHKREKKLTLPLADSIIAITAIALKAQLATKNEKHFTQIDLVKLFKF